MSDGVLRPCKGIYLGGAYFADLIPTANAVFDEFRMSNLSVRDEMRVDKLDLLQIAQAAIGEARLESIPLYEDRYFGYIEPKCNWYNIEFAVRF